MGIRTMVNKQNLRCVDGDCDRLVMDRTIDTCRLWWIVIVMGTVIVGPGRRL
jgi:hypothetical protein